MAFEGVCVETQWVFWVSLGLLGLKWVKWVCLGFSFSILGFLCVYAYGYKRQKV